MVGTVDNGKGDEKRTKRKRKRPSGRINGRGTRGYPKPTNKDLEQGIGNIWERAHEVEVWECRRQALSKGKCL